MRNQKRRKIQERYPTKKDLGHCSTQKKMVNIGQAVVKEPNYEQWNFMYTDYIETKLLCL